VDALLGQRGIESYLPLIPRIRQWKDRKKVVAWPLFPSYVFSRFSLTQLHHVLGVPGVATVVRSNGHPVAIATAELENVRRFAERLSGPAIQVELRPYIAEGQWVRIEGGPFEGVKGIVIERRNKKRVLLGIAAIGRGLEIDVDTRLLTAIPGP
jgi:transcription antitermination factor NusG